MTQLTEIAADTPIRVDAGTYYVRSSGGEALRAYLVRDQWPAGAMLTIAYEVLINGEWREVASGGAVGGDLLDSDGRPVTTSGFSGLTMSRRLSATERRMKVTVSRTLRCTPVVA